MSEAVLKLSRFVPWFGANAENAALPAQLLVGAKWVYIPFAGSMCEVPHFPASVQVMVSDVHDDLINLADIVMREETRGKIIELVSGLIFHPATLERARDVLAQARDPRGGLFGGGAIDPVERAAAYFTVAWMGRSGVSGTDGEARAGLALRYDGGGGDPVKRFDAAVASLEGWHAVLRRCQVTREDAFAVLSRVAARAMACPAGSLGIYADPPWPDDGDGYLHRFSEANQRAFATLLSQMRGVRIVVRYGDHPLIRELYTENLWEWRMAAGRTQARNDKREVFLVRRGGAA